MGQKNLEAAILSLLSEPNYTPLDLEKIRVELKLGKKESNTLEATVKQLLKKGIISRIKRDRFVLPKDADLITGVIKFRTNGSAILIPETPSGAEILNIESWDTSVALHEDRVIVRIKKGRPKNYRANKNRNNNTLDAQVVRILERTHRPIIGTLQKSRSFYYVAPDDPRIVKDILIPNPRSSSFKPSPEIGHKVVVELVEWEQQHLNPFGEIIDVLGETHSADAEFQAILRKYDLNPEFPKDVIKAVKKIPSKVSKKDIKNRLDCTKLLTFTIDPDDAKDFDDALSVEYLPRGNVKVGIHIADVGAYVKSGSPIDREAEKRGNSTYLVGSVIPMLPHELSNGICSLVENEDRLTKCVFVTFTKSGKIKEVSFSNTVIRSQKRLTYKQAYAFLTEDDLDTIKSTPLPPAHQTGSTGRRLQDLSDKELLNLQKAIRQLWGFASSLRKKRLAEGSLDIEMPEIKIRVNPEGRASNIEKIHNDESHQLIEEFMLLANEWVARELSKTGVPFISRVHDEPNPEKLDDLRDTLRALDVSCRDLTKKSSVTRLLKLAKEHSQGYSIKIQFLRSLKQACYRASEDGHYGLHKQHYTHFTSPIRRYSDLLVHRIFDNFLLKQRNPTAVKESAKAYKNGELEQFSRHISRTEQNSTEAERESVKVKLLEFFELENQKQVKTPFKAIITEIRNHGLFVELTESLAFGFIRMSSLRNDLYRLNGSGTAIIGRRTKKSFEVGQEIDVIVTRVDRFQRQMDFSVFDNHQEKRPKSKKNRSPSRKRNH